MFRCEQCTMYQVSLLFWSHVDPGWLVGHSTRNKAEREHIGHMVDPGWLGNVHHAVACSKRVSSSEHAHPRSVEWEKISGAAPTVDWPSWSNTPCSKDTIHWPTCITAETKSLIGLWTTDRRSGSTWRIDAPYQA